MSETAPQRPGREPRPDGRRRLLAVGPPEEAATLAARLAGAPDAPPVEVEAAADARAAAAALRDRRFDALLVDLRDPADPARPRLAPLSDVAPHAGEVALIARVADPRAPAALAALRAGAQEIVPAGADGPALREALERALARQARMLDLERAVERARYEATHDGLTRLPNRTYFHGQLREALRDAQRYRRGIAVLYLDLDNLKWVNDRLGHETGDRLLQEAAARIRGALRRSDVAARLGGDEFAVLIRGVRRSEDAERVARTLLGALERPYAAARLELAASASIGIALYPGPCEDAPSLLRAADHAMYAAKAEGGAKYRVYRGAAPGAAEKPALDPGDLRRALRLGELRLHFQRQVDVRTGAVRGMEALLRWEHPGRGLLLPRDILPAAEAAGLIESVDTWVLREACARRAEARARGVDWEKLSVNLSLHQLRRPDLAPTVRRILEETGTPPEALELEICERRLIAESVSALPTLLRLKRLGVRITLDDFGNGLASLSHLRSLPCDAVRIAPSFVHGASEGPSGRRMERTILDVAESLGLDVVAKLVETDEDVRQLQEHGCHRMQGFLFGVPQPADALEGAGALPQAG